MAGSGTFGISLVFLLCLPMKGSFRIRGKPGTLLTPSYHLDLCGEFGWFLPGMALGAEPDFSFCETGRGVWRLRLSYYSLKAFLFVSICVLLTHPQTSPK